MTEFPIINGVTSVSRARVLAIHQGAELFGSDRMFLEAVLGIAKSADVTVLLPDDGPLAERFRSAGITVDTRPVFILRKRLLRPRGWRELASTARAGAVAIRAALREHNPDVVYVNTITIPAVLGPSRRSGRRVVVHVHEAEQATSRGARARNRVLYLPLHQATRIICNSEFTRSIASASAPGIGERMEVIPNGVPSVPATAPRTQLDGELRVAYIGRLSPRKGPDVLLDAVRRLAEPSAVSVRLVGSVFAGYEWYRSQLRGQIAGLPPSVDVSMTGFDPDVASHLQWCDVVVVPSRLDESFGNAAIEGILARRPVIGSDIAALREVTAGIKTVRLVRPGDADELASALDAVCTSWPQLTEAVQQAASEAERRFSPEVFRSRVAAAVLDN